MSDWRDSVGPLVDAVVDARERAAGVWTVSYFAGEGETFAGKGPTIAAALENCLRDAFASSERAAGAVAAMRRERIALTGDA